VFADRPKLADAVNRLLVVGFYMLNLGYAFYIVRASRGLDAFAAVQYLVNRLAVLLVSLAILHFLNVFVFWRIRARREQREMPPPVPPQVVIPPPPHR
jgi:membrane protein implicated in regulation of membrane protease activity